jgi:hypothetical protein
MVTSFFSPFCSKLAPLIRHLQGCSLSSKSTDEQVALGD